MTSSTTSPTRPDRFYKYATAAGALAMLRTRSAWWKSPPLFNDPFDTQLELNIGCDANDILAAMTPRLEQLIFSDEVLLPSIDDDVKKAILLARAYARAHPEERGAILAGLPLGFRGKLPEIEKALKNGQGLWTAFLNRMRVFCVSELKDDILMWAHYAECHRGAVLELRPLSGMRGALREAFPIRYEKEIPVMASAAQWGDHVLGVAPIDFDSFFEAFAFSKSEHWQYEREWRCRILDADPNRDVPGMGMVWACPLLPDEVVAVYLGCRMDAANRTAIADAVRSRFPATEIYEATKSATRFSLEFRKVR